MKFSFFILSLVLLTGCFAHRHLVEMAPPAVSGQVIDADKLQSGGKLGLTMFKAGPQAYDDDRLDHVSMLLIKGIRDSLQSQSTHFVLTTDSSQADFLLSGYVEEFSRSRLALSGEIWDHDTGKKILNFASSRQLKRKKENADDAAYAMGKAIGDFIAAQTKAQE